MIEVIEYISVEGKNAFDQWAQTLDDAALARVTTAVARIQAGNLGDVKPVGGGVSETAIHTGPGYRVYFGRDGNTLVILLGGGTKKKQSRDIAAAQASWAEYKATKRKK